MTRTFGDFWRMWKASQGLPSRDVTSSPPIAPTQRPPRIWPCYCGSTNFSTLPSGRLICKVCYRRRRSPVRAHFEAA